MGTSGWVAASTDRRAVDTEAMAASVVGAIPGRYNYISEQETSGKCMEWVRDHLALDEIGLYLGARHAAEDPRAPLRHALRIPRRDDRGPWRPAREASSSRPGSTARAAPSRTPTPAGMFFNIGVETGKRCLVRAVAEGTRPPMPLAARRDPAQGARPTGPLRFVGGGARSLCIGAILADATGERVEVPEHPQDSGALGAAMLCAVGLGLASDLEAAASLVPVARSYEPRAERREIYERGYAALKRLYYCNKETFRMLNDPKDDRLLRGSKAPIAAREP